MAGSGDIWIPPTAILRKRDQLVITTLKNLRAKGHSYVDLREDGGRLIFFCTLCLARCHDDENLLHHLNGNIHTKRMASAKLTLLKQNPWPFDDGENFFGGSTKNKNDNNSSNDKLTSTDYTHGTPAESVDSNNDDENLAIVPYDQNLDHGINVREGVDGENLDENRTCNVVIPGVLMNDVISDLEVSRIGFGKIAARVHGKDSVKISKLWCEWLGKRDPGDEEMVNIPEHNFGVVALTYNDVLGRKGYFEDLLSLLPPSTIERLENAEGGERKRIKSASEQGYVRGSSSSQGESSGEESAASLGSLSTRAAISTFTSGLVYESHRQALVERLMSSKTFRKELRKQQRDAAGRTCSICQHVMLPGKDVGTLLNMKTGKLACSSRNFTGAFHVFHISCLIHWILFCEYEIYTNQSVSSKVKKKSKRKNEAKKDTRAQIRSVCCPECQGTGMNIEGRQLEAPPIPASEIYNYKIKLHDAKRAWMANPEMLQNCSTGFHFPSELYKSIEEKVSALKLLHFFVSGM